MWDRKCSRISATPILPLPRSFSPYLILRLAPYPGSDQSLLNDDLSTFAMTSALQQSITALSLGQHKKLQLALALLVPLAATVQL
ncbi:MULTISPECIES: hypothetical protein [unclassified Janthinobacterium]|uniref:hypothetical protein n=1 Tax=unclassified Janthinobacterium TaxID=2610881 RepID=UPI001E3662FF|nr:MULTISPECIES: hypothetical protein [unclassified Janthinobacterium]MCC7645783.1 hypothetical protein [Janthinobacterium sp. EB271-G4-3-1]MCC7693901.1 hypothetical protein [Janthinobacterium sp. EB271-G4-3-2]